MSKLPLFGQPEGETFDAELDGQRLNAQQRLVWRAMRKYAHEVRREDLQWWTLRELANETGAPEASISARLRDFRKLGHEVERRRRGGSGRGIWEYRLIPHETCRNSQTP